MLVGLSLLLTTIVLRGATAKNRYIRGKLLIRPRWRSAKELNYQDGSDNYRSTSVRHYHSSSRKLRKLQPLDSPE